MSVRRAAATMAAVAACGLTLAGCGLGLSSTTEVARVATCPSVAPTPIEQGQQQTIVSGGIARTYHLWLPANAASQPTPVVLDFHGTGSPAIAYARDLSPMSRIGPTRGYIVVAPQGSSDGTSLPRWSVPGLGAEPDDVRFTEDVLAQLSREYCVDPDRVYASGTSAGAAMTGYLSCRSDLLAAAAPVAGVNLARACPDRPPLSIVAFQGKQDYVAPYEGIPGADTAAESAFYAGAVDTVMAGWSQRAECADGPTSTVVAPDVYLQEWQGCAEGVDVQLYVATDAGHTYPGGPVLPEYVESITGTVDSAGGQTDSIDAASLMLDFFDEHRRVHG